MKSFTAVNSMSWYNPSQDEAADEYYSSKSRYANAANQRYEALKAATSCGLQKAQALGAIESFKSDKINFEKRIEDIRTVIGAIEGGGGNILISMMGGDLPGIISDFNMSAQQADTSYQESMKCPDIKSASFSDVFKNKSVSEDFLLSAALQMFKNEINRLEEALHNLETQINNLTDMADELTAKINMYNIEQVDCRRVMVNCAFEMNHFKLYM